MDNPSKLNYEYEHVFYVNSPEDLICNPVAIRPKIYDNMVLWEDTSKGTIIYLGKLEHSPELEKPFPEKIQFSDQNGKKFELIKLTLGLYNEKVKQRVALQPSFDSDEAVQEFYLNEIFGPY